MKFRLEFLLVILICHQRVGRRLRSNPHQVAFRLSYSDESVFALRNVMLPDRIVASKVSRVAARKLIEYYVNANPKKKNYLFWIISLTFRENLETEFDKLFYKIEEITKVSV